MSRSSRFEVAGGTLTGHHRENVNTAIDRRLGWLAVSDGPASRSVLDIVQGCFYAPGSTWNKGTLVSTEGIESHLFTSLVFTNFLLRETTADTDRELATTFAGVIILPGQMWISHIGDSRIYRRRGPTLERLTTDHRMRDDPWARAQLSPSAIESLSPNDLTRALGLNEVAMSETRNVDWSPDDIVILTTRGITDTLDDATIAEVFERNQDLETATAKLVDRARACGAAHPATVLAARYAP